MKHHIIIACLSLLPLSTVMAQETSKEVKEKVEVTIKDGDNPDVYIDGKKYDHSIVELLDKDKIESISVLKDEQALKRYNAPNGVILIETKSKKDQVTIRFRDGAENEVEPLIIIDGKTVNRKELEKMDKEDISSIEVFKGEEALKKYKAKDGAIIITTKSADKKKK